MHGLENSDIRLQILEAANSIVSASGPEALSLSSICAATKTSPALLAKLFGSRDGIVTAAAKFRLARYTEGWANIQPSGSPLEDFRSAWNYHNEFIYLHPPMPQPSSGAWAVTSSQIDSKGLSIITGRLAPLRIAKLLRVSDERASLLVQVAVMGWAAAVIDQHHRPRDPHGATFICESLLLMLTSTRVRPSSDALTLAAMTLADNIFSLKGVSPGEASLIHEVLTRGFDR